MKREIDMAGRKGGLLCIFNKLQRIDKGRGTQNTLVNNESRGEKID